MISTNDVKTDLQVLSGDSCEHKFIIGYDGK